MRCVFSRRIIFFSLYTLEDIVLFLVLVHVLPLYFIFVLLIIVYLRSMRNVKIIRRLFIVTLEPNENVSFCLFLVCLKNRSKNKMDIPLTLIECFVFCVFMHGKSNNNNNNRGTTASIINQSINRSTYLYIYR